MGVVCGDCARMRRSKPHRGSQNDETPECLGSAGKPEKHSRGWKVIGSSPLLPHTVKT